MQDLSYLTSILLLCSCFTAIYGSLIITYLILRRRARRAAAGLPIIQIPWWKVFCSRVWATLVAGAISWTLYNGILFTILISSLSKICPSLITQDQCEQVAQEWQLLLYVWIPGEALVAILALRWVMFLEANRPASAPERSYPWTLLACSHGMLVSAWLMCVPLLYPRELFKSTGTKHWTHVSTTFAWTAVLEHIIGTTVWIVALIKYHYVRRRRLFRRGAPDGAQWPGTQHGDIPLQDMHP